VPTAVAEQEVAGVFMDGDEGEWIERGLDTMRMYESNLG